MTGQEMADCLDALRWMGQDLSDATGISLTRIRRMAVDEAEVPPAIAAWLADLARYHREHPAPPKPGAH